MSKYLFTSFVIISFILGLGTGFIISPEYTNKMSDRKVVMIDLGRADRYVDLRYLNGMIAHHLKALYLSKQAASHSQRPEIKQLAIDIVKADEKGIVELYQWKKTLFNDTRRIVNYEKINLGSFDDKFDLRYINAIIAHHDEAIMVAREIRTKSMRNEILNLADSVIQGLGKNRETLVGWQTNWYK